MKATVENPRGSVEKLSPKESVKGAHTVLRGSLRAPEGFSGGHPAQPGVASPPAGGEGGRLDHCGHGRDSYTV